MGEKIMLTVDEMGRLLGISQRKAYELSRSEDFPVLRIGRRVLIPRDQLDAWIKIHMKGLVVQ